MASLSGMLRGARSGARAPRSAEVDIAAGTHDVEPRDPVSPGFVYGLGAAVTLAWLASVFADILVAHYSTPIALHGLMGTVVGSVFADAGLRRARRRLISDDDRN